MISLRALIVEDSEPDTLLLLRELRKTGYSIAHRRVDAEEEMERALTEQEWDIILCDYAMPNFSGPAALKILQRKGLDIPFIMVSGQIGEDTAVEAMKAGAQDYVLKGNLKRLGPAVQREVSEARLRRERLQAERELKAREEELRLAKKSEQLKDEFIGLVSHELRTPLTVFLAAVKVAETEGITTEEIQELLKEAERSAVSLSQILDNLIELYRYQTDRLQLTTERLNPAQFISDLLETEKARLQKHTFSLDIEQELPLIEIDRIRVQQVLRNLLDNAAKYSPPGTEIRTWVKQENDHLVIGVSDYGKGISKADQCRLFEPFQRMEESPAVSATKGLGLGLMVCKRLVEVHGGKIWCDSQPGECTTFYFTLPLSTAVY